jgi:hypothetical protein
VTYTRVSAGDLDALTAVSERYQAQAVLAGGLQMAAGSWRGRWALRHAGQETQWQTGEAPLAAALDQSLAPVEGKLVTRAPALPADAAPARLTVRIQGVLRLQDYARVDQYLRGLPTVRRAELLAAQGQQLEYAVEVQGGAQGWAQAVATDALLEPVTAADAAAGGLTVYRLRP